MKTFAIYANDDCAVIDLLRGSGISGVVFKKAAGTADALFVAPGTKQLSNPAVSIAITPPGCTVSAQSVVTYGLGSRESLTFSAINEEGAVLALRRSMVNFNGELIDPFEIPLNIHNDLELSLGLCGVLLVCGVQPQDLIKYQNQA